MSVLSGIRNRRRSPWVGSHRIPREQSSRIHPCFQRDHGRLGSSRVQRHRNGVQGGMKAHHRAWHRGMGRA